MRHPILILGGTTEARLLAVKLAENASFAVTLSLAGRTQRPAEQGVPVRIGGFGGAQGMAAYLAENKVVLLVDATHPYAARISANAAQAAHLAHVPLIALRRPGWKQVRGDRWTSAEDGDAVVRALGEAPRRVFLAFGRQELGPFEAAPQHCYLIRSVDPIEPPLAVPDARYILARGPFDEADEAKLLLHERIDAIVCKNSGGAATYGKIAAARKLGVEVIMIARPVLQDAPSGASVEEVAQMVARMLD